MNPIFLLLFAILCSGGLDSAFVDGISTIKPGEELKSGAYLVSEGGNFTLGFFTIEETSYSYIGIWYTNDDQQRKVWVANRNSPISDNSSVLTVDSTTGILKIIRGGNTILNISDQVTGNNATATLEDTGNFILTDWVEKRTLWESFDHPTDTLLPDGHIAEGPSGLRFGPFMFCYGYESDDGCVTSELPQCRRRNDNFTQKRVYFLPNITTRQDDDNSSLSLSACMERCWNECNCVAFNVNSNGTGCITWTGRSEYKEDDVDIDPLYLLLRDPKSSRGKKDVDMDSHCSGYFCICAHRGNLLLSKHEKTETGR
ncbi:hypothetical protein Acr_25g0010240 [Actinidia rufa]|uniref:non-specific serine/threonine protein kinase n=1 Tax=Actinidia rufa TaxID=165716 RepID=A0A7J0H0J3_9ERIC|nr:hypothetical protein Acr_25g0010240 [Actinidia rufa]